MTSEAAIRPLASRPTASAVAASADLTGKTAIVTGASSGLGVETARALAAAGATVFLAVRNPAAGEAIADGIWQDFGRKAKVAALDLADLKSVGAFADGLKDAIEVLDLLIANAGVSKTPAAHLDNGLDVRFATNHLGHFLLANLLHEKMAVRGARIVILSSAAHKSRPVQFGDLQRQKRPRDDLAAYGESKTANILFAMEASRRWSADGIFANAVLPGSALTGLQRYHGEELKRAIGFIREDGTLNPNMKSVEEGAATIVWAAVAPELAGCGGLVLEDCGIAEPVGPQTHPWSGYNPAVLSVGDATALWEQSLRILAQQGFLLPDCSTQEAG